MLSLRLYLTSIPQICTHSKAHHDYPISHDTHTMPSHTPASWASLPAELRLQILEPIAHQKPPGWSSLASVCKEWQLVFEKENFKKLKIGSRDLRKFADIVSPRRRHLIRHIWLEVELRRYKTRCCSKRSSQLSTIMGSTVTDAIQQMFEILSTWETGHELTLELNVVCPTDSEHWFRNMHFSSDCVDDGGKPAKLYGADCYHHDPHHGWKFDVQTENPPHKGMEQLLSPIVLDEPRPGSKPLPTVRAVTQLVIRRQLRRRLISFSLAELLKQLPCLENIVYEPWFSRARFTDRDDECMSSIIHIIQFVIC